MTVDEQAAGTRPGPAPGLRLVGYLDARNVGAVRQSLNELVDITSGTIVVDLSEVELIDATGLGVLAAAHRRLERDGRQLVLRGCTGQIRRVLAMTGLLRVMHVEPAGKVAG
ncbi:MAG: STAS domain-containing protein [Actinomycetota bacterium]|nr:STAS domain-containing protein [Actinomycetota bacterium]